MDEETHLTRIQQMIDEGKSPKEIMREIKRIEQDELPDPKEQTKQHKSFLKRLKKLNKTLKEKEK